MSTFITNTGENNLKDRINTLIKQSVELKFLVGFFYFSGIRELYEGLKSNNNFVLKILVGLNIDLHNNKLIESVEDENRSIEEIVNSFFNSIKTSFKKEEFDTKEFIEEVKFFIELIISKKLIIRKTEEPNHAKLYLFHFNEIQIGRNRFITGSSNLTKPGLTTQNEFNVEIGDYGYDKALKYFDDEWDKSIKITEDDVTKNKLINIIEEETFLKQLTPFEAFCLVIHTYLDIPTQKEIGKSLIDLLESNGYKKYNYQIDAIKQSLSIIEKNNGVVIADVVGLGKTIIACLIASQLKLKGLVICPPSLIGNPKLNDSGWNKYLSEFKLKNLGWEVRSLGDMENNLEFVKNSNDIEIIIVDEAHRFRNDDTQDYELLQNICRNKKVILLTATPFNNEPNDILSLLNLFIVPKKSEITLNEDLVKQFSTFDKLFYNLGYIKRHHDSKILLKRENSIRYNKSIFENDIVDLKKVSHRAHKLSKEIKAILEPVTIRRNRLDLQKNPNYSSEVKDLSTVADPIEWFFELSTDQSKFYNEVIESYFGEPDSNGRFKGAIYQPFNYQKKITNGNLNEEDNRRFQQQKNLYDFMRTLLVKRFESSFGSFEQSIKNFKNVSEICREFIINTNKFILDRGLIKKIHLLDPEEIELELIKYKENIKEGNLPKNHDVYEVDKFERRDEFLADINSDINLFDEILLQVSKLELINNDPKTSCLIKNLKIEFSKPNLKNEPKRKIIIFSEYADTVLHLEPALRNVFKDKLLVVEGDLPNSKINTINKNFDASLKEQENDFDLILSTDKISEGFNLNRAGMVINYDIPWNPVRVIQRLGRINRISKKVFNELFIVNFFPTETGATLVQSREIAANKMFLIHNALGEDSKIFNIDEEPTASSLYKRLQVNPDTNEVESFYTKVLNFYYNIKIKYPEIIDKIKNTPPLVKVAKHSTENELLVFFKKTALFVVGKTTVGENTKPYNLTFEETFNKIITTESEVGLDWNTDNFWNNYEEIKDYKDVSTVRLAEQSVLSKALIKIETLLNSNNDNLIPYKKFIRLLKEDINSYGTINKFTLRRIKDLEENDITALEILKNELGEDFLDKIKNKRFVRKEIIIAIENKTK